MIRKLLIVAFTFFSFTTCVFSQIIFVNSASSGTNDGSSWENAYQNLTSALNAANSNSGITQVWVAEGTYLPSSTNNRDDFFNLRRNNLQLYGGFAGNETAVEQRNVNAHLTTLSGNIGLAESNTDNSYHIMVIELDPEAPVAIDNSLVIDGFTFSDGNANAGSVFNNLYPRYTGGSIFISCNFNSINITPLIRNCSFINNWAFSSGAVTYYGISSTGNSFRVEDCNFQNNYSGYTGAAIDVMQLDAAGYGVPGLFSVVIERSSFTGNSVDNYSQGGANGGIGAGINTFGQGTLLVNRSAFINNTIGSSTTFAGSYKGTAISARNGGVVTIINTVGYANNNYIPLYNMQSTFNMVNSTFYNPAGSVLDLNAPVNNTIQNSILWTDDNTENVMTLSNGTATINIANSILNATYQGTATLSNVLNSDPLFANPGAGDFSLQQGSPAINNGDNSFYDESYMGNTDQLGANRTLNVNIDMGAYEYTGALPVNFGAINATVGNDILHLNWSTLTESNNDHFEIEISADGKHFSKLAIVQSKSLNGNSATLLEYHHQISISDALASLGISSLALLGLLTPTGKKRRLLSITIVIAGALFFSCSKNDSSRINANQYIYLRIAQVDKDGSKDYSKTIRVVSQ